VYCTVLGVLGVATIGCMVGGVALMAAVTTRGPSSWGLEWAKACVRSPGDCVWHPSMARANDAIGRRGGHWVRDETQRTPGAMAAKAQAGRTAGARPRRDAHADADTATAPTGGSGVVIECLAVGGECSGESRT